MEAFRALHAQRDLCLDLFFLHSATVGGKFFFFLKESAAEPSLSWLLGFTRFSVFAVCSARWSVRPPSY